MAPENSVRPMETRELFGTAFRLYRRHLAPLWRINLVYVLILIVGNGLGSPFVLEGQLGAPVALATALAQLVIYAAVVIAASNAVLGRPVRAGNALGRALAGRTLLKLLLLALPFALLEVLSKTVVSGRHNIFLWLCGSLFWLLAPLLLRIALLFASPVSILEKRSVGDTLLRAWSLSVGNFGKSFVNYGLLFVLPYRLAQSAFPLLNDFFRSLVSLSVNGSLAQPLQGNLVFFLVSQMVLALVIFLFNPLGNLLATLLYYDVRVRKENFDEEVLAEELGYRPITEFITE